jgi:branched-chain amino acid aminotransferase
MSTPGEIGAKQPFGKVLAAKMAVAQTTEGEWNGFNIQDLAPLSLDPSTHVLHYASTCFEGLKVHRGLDGVDRVFRIDRHAARMRRSAEMLCLPIPSEGLFEEMVMALTRAIPEWIPAHPGSLYLRPTLIGTEPTIGAAAKPSGEAMLFVVAAPVSDYLGGASQAINVLIDDEHMRCVPDFGMAKAGGNYATCIRHVVAARKKYPINQVLFAPGGDVQEAGVANFLFIKDNRILVKGTDPAVLEGITRDTLLVVGRDLGFTVEERDISVTELLEWAPRGEAALSGTAAILGGIGTFIYRDRAVTVGDGGFGDQTKRLRDALIAIQNGSAPDRHGWLQTI